LLVEIEGEVNKRCENVGGGELLLRTTGESSLLEEAVFPPVVIETRHYVIAGIAFPLAQNSGDESSFKRENSSKNHGG
jgi:hypothetical protein